MRNARSGSKDHLFDRRIGKSGLYKVMVQI